MTTTKPIKMKKITILFLAVTATIFTTISCKNDDDAASAASIVGTWKIVSEFEGGVNSNLSGCELDEEISFAASTGSYKVLDDDTVTPCTFDNLPFTYTLTGNNLALSVTGFFPVTTQAVIEELTNTTLRLRIISDSFSGVYPPEDVIVVTYTRI